MATRTYTHVQRDFSAGELSERLLFRDDQEVYNRGTLEMTNFLPTPQGTAKKMPGTRYLLDTGATSARIIPYLTSANERCLLLLTPLNAKLLVDINDFVDGNISEADLTGGGGLVTYKKPLIGNGDFTNKQDWTFTPEGPLEGNNGDPGLGGYIQPAKERAILNPRYYKWPNVEPQVVTMTTTQTVDVATDVAVIEYSMEYLANPPQNLGDFRLEVTVEDAANLGTNLYEATYAQNQYDVGDRIDILANVTMPTVAWTGDLVVTVTLTALQNTVKDDGIPEYSNPQWAVQEMQMFVNGESTLTEVDLVTPYTAEELPDVQYVQSPYADKEIVFTHPNHPPQRLIFDTGGGQYVWQQITFSNTPAAWSANNYPSCCTAEAGRLVLAGGQTFKIEAGNPVGSVSESIWATVPGDWTAFTLANFQSAGDSFYLETTYRSPIQWVAGHKDLLVGAQEMEYTVRLGVSGAAEGGGPSTDAELWAVLNSTHGSINVPPANFGDGVMFAAEGGRKVRFLQFSDENRGWLVPDVSLMNPEITQSGIRRMTRVRSPQQMLWCVLNNGQVAIFHKEQTVEGWTRYEVFGSVVDMCVLANEEGRDVPYFLIDRGGNLVLEAIPEFSKEEKWIYQHSHKFYQFDAPTDTITGLAHLEGEWVQVWEPFRFLGTWQVSGGQIVLTTEWGQNHTVTRPVVGKVNTARMTTMPIPKADPASVVSIKNITVRTLGSTRPIINGQRPDDRDPRVALALSQGYDLLGEPRIPEQGSAGIKQITVEEHLPLKCEVLGIYSELKVASI